MRHILILILALVLLAFLTLGCGLEGWDIDRTSDEYTAVQTRQAQGLPLDTPTPQEAQSW